MIRLRLVQHLMGAGYALTAALALAEAPGVASLAVAAALALSAFATGKIMPDVRVPSSMILHVCGVGLVVLGAGIVVDIAGGPHALGWATAVMAYCAGNRFKAGGVGAT